MGQEAVDRHRAGGELLEPALDRVIEVGCAPVDERHRGALVDDGQAVLDRVLRGEWEVRLGQRGVQVRRRERRHVPAREQHVGRLRAGDEVDVLRREVVVLGVRRDRPRHVTGGDRVRSVAGDRRQDDHLELLGLVRRPRQRHQPRAGQVEQAGTRGELGERLIGLVRGVVRREVPVRRPRLQGLRGPGRRRRLERRVITVEDDVVDGVGTALGQDQFGQQPGRHLTVGRSELERDDALLLSRREVLFELGERLRGCADAQLRRHVHVHQQADPGVGHRDPPQRPVAHLHAVGAEVAVELKQLRGLPGDPAVLLGVAVQVDEKPGLHERPHGLVALVRLGDIAVIRIRQEHRADVAVHIVLSAPEGHDMGVLPHFEGGHHHIALQQQLLDELAGVFIGAGLISAAQQLVAKYVVEEAVIGLRGRPILAGEVHILARNIHRSALIRPALPLHPGMHRDQSLLLWGGLGPAGRKRLSLCHHRCHVLRGGGCHQQQQGALAPGMNQRNWAKTPRIFAPQPIVDRQLVDDFAAFMLKSRPKE